MRALVAVALLTGAACTPGEGTAPGSGEVEGTLTVLGAASLTTTFGEIGRRFEAANRDAELTFSFAASSALARQVRAGARADVIAVADRRHVDGLAREGLAGTPRVFARNRLAILVARGNPAAIRGLGDLDRPGVVVVLCAVEVPCGSLAGEVLAGAGVRVRPRSYEPDVKAVVARVLLGEADAGVVYTTDARAAGGRVEAVPIPPRDNRSTDYALAPLVPSSRPALARAFVEFVATGPGRQVLLDAGFGAP